MEIIVEEGVALARISLADAWSRAALGEALNEVVAASRDFDLILARSKHGYFRFQFLLGEQPDLFDPLDEEIFFARTALFDELDAHTLEYVSNITTFLEQNNWSGTQKYLGGLWHDQMHQAGCFAIEPLAMKNPAHLAAYGRYLASNDLGHEVHQSSFINGACEKHGWRDETLQLVARRLALGTDGLWLLEPCLQTLALPKYLRQNDLEESFADFYLGFALEPPLAIQPRAEGEEADEASLDFARQCIGDAKGDLEEVLAAVVEDPARREDLNARGQQRIEAAFAAIGWRE